MKRLIIMAALAVAAFGFTQASAQKVIKDAAGNVFIDVTDMPAGSFSNTTLNRVSLSTDAGNSVYKKLQIAKADLSSKVTWAVAVGLATSYNTATATGQTQGTVNTGCKSFTEGGVSGWRVPTQRELQLIWIMKDTLTTAGGGPFANGFYWTSNENNATSSWYVTFNIGHMANGTKTSTANNTRCVREM